MLYMEQKLYSIKDLVPILRLHPKTLLRFIGEGKIRARKIGRSWMVHEDDLREYAHAELAGSGRSSDAASAGAPPERVAASAVVEISGWNPEEASRLSNHLIAMLNGKDESRGRTRFDFSYDPAAGRAKYTLYGRPSFLAAAMRAFEPFTAGRED